VQVVNGNRSRGWVSEPGGTVPAVCRPAAVAVFALLSVVALGCSELPTSLDEAREGAEAGVDRIRDAIEDGDVDPEALLGEERFCLALTRTINAIESDAPATAREAAEEVLARAPQDVTDEARELAERLRDMEGSVEDDEARELAESLRRTAADRCGTR
jgi:hypothetical protein